MLNTINDSIDMPVMVRTYRLLARFFFTELDLALFQEINSGHYRDSFDILGFNLEIALPDFDEVTLLNSVKFDYQRLFAGEKPLIDLRQSRWHAGAKKFSRTLYDVERLFQLYQLSLDDAFEGFKLIPDHLSAIYLLLSQLTQIETSAQNSQQLRLYDEVREIASFVIINHLANWLPELAGSIERFCATDFYHQLALSAHQLLRNEITQRRLKLQRRTQSRACRY